MARFEILGGRHVGGDGSITEFEKGRRTYVEDDLPLDKMFKNKFRRADEPTKVRAESDRADLSGGKVTDDPLIIRTKNAKLKKKAEDAARKAIAKVMEDHEPEEFEDDEDDDDRFTDLTPEGMVGRKKKTKLVPTDELDEEEPEETTAEDAEEEDGEEPDDTDDEEVDLTKDAPKGKVGVASPAEGKAGKKPISGKKQLKAGAAKTKTARK
jgi:hypothetical protein